MRRVPFIVQLEYEDGEERQQIDIDAGNSADVYNSISNCEDDRDLYRLSVFRHYAEEDEELEASETAFKQCDRATTALSAITAASPINEKSYVVPQSIREVDASIKEALPQDDDVKRGIVVVSGLFCGMFRDLKKQGGLKSAQFYKHFLGDGKRLPKHEFAWKTACDQVENARMRLSMSKCRPPYWNSIKSSLKGGRYRKAEELLKDVENVLFGVILHPKASKDLQSEAVKCCTYLVCWIIRRCVSALQQGDAEDTRLTGWINKVREG